MATLRVARLLTLGSVAEILYSKQYVTPLISRLAPQTGKMKQVLCFDRPPELAWSASCTWSRRFVPQEEMGVSETRGRGWAGPGPGSGSIFLKKYAVLGLGLGLC